MKHLTVICSLFLAAVLLVGCSSAKSADLAVREEAFYSSGSSTSAEAPMASAAPEAMEPESSYDSSYGLTEGSAASDADLATRYGGHKVILTYEATLRTDDFDSLLDALSGRLDMAGGYAESTSVNGKKPEVYGDGGRTAMLTLRVPAEKVDSFFTDVKAMGSLLNEQAYAEDVTEQYFDRETRLAVLETQLDRLRSILVETDNLADIIALETEIARVMTEIESLTGELRRYDGLINFATVHITVYENMLRQGPAADDTLGSRIRRGLSDSVYGIGTFFADLLVWFISALPAFAVIALCLVPIVLIIRAIRRKNARRKAEKKTALAPENNK